MQKPRSNQYPMPRNWSRKINLSIALLLGALSVSYSQTCEPADCLWPGDANRNGVANHLDVLWLGLATADVIGGPLRDNATFSWTPQDPPADWASSYPVSGTNFKYADSNGDGWIDGMDLDLFPHVYGQMNDQFSGFLGNDIPGDDLFYEISNPNPQPGEIVDVSIHLGDADNFIEGISGIAFTVTWDTAIVNEQATVFNEVGGWMNVAGPDFYSSAKLDGPLGIVEPEIALTRLEGTTVSGAGEIVQMRIVIEDVIVGLDGQPVDSVQLDLGFKQVLGLNGEEEDLLITHHGTQLLVTDLNRDPKPDMPAKVRIHSGSNQLSLSLEEQADGLCIYNVNGQRVRRWATGFTDLEFPIGDWPAGIYFFQFVRDEHSWVQRVFIGK